MGRMITINYVLRWLGRILLVFRAVAICFPPGPITSQSATDGYSLSKYGRSIARTTACNRGPVRNSKFPDDPETGCRIRIFNENQNRPRHAVKRPGKPKLHVRKRPVPVFVVPGQMTRTALATRRAAILSDSSASPTTARPNWTRVILSYFTAHIDYSLNVKQMFGAGLLPFVG